MKRSSLFFSMRRALTPRGGDETSGDGDGDSGDDGQVIEPFDAYCVATFDVETPVQDVFGDTLFTAAAGSRYLLTKYEDASSAELLFLSPDGPVDFEVTATGGALPFSTDCVLGQTQRYAGVFTDVTVYEDLELTTELCQLSASLLWPSTGGGYSLESGFSDDPATYSISVDGLEDHCNGASSGYIPAPNTQVLGSFRTLVPIQFFAGPA
jgi:hypothetical protein